MRVQTDFRNVPFNYHQWVETSSIDYGGNGIYKWTQQECSCQWSIGGNLFHSVIHNSAICKWKVGMSPSDVSERNTVMSVTGMWEQLLHCLLFMHTYNYDNSIKLKFVLLSKSVMSCSLLWIYFYLWEVCFCRQIILVVVNKYKF